MKVALIAGAGGAASKRLVDVLLADPEWSVIGLARTPRTSATRLRWIAADLFDRAACGHALAGERGVTHVFYTARAKHGEVVLRAVAVGREDVEREHAANEASRTRHEVPHRRRTA